MKESPIKEVTIEKILQDTGAVGRPFYSKVSEIKRVRFFGILIYKESITGNFPETENKK